MHKLKKRMKNQVNEAIDLMNRMNLFEANGNPRIQVGRDEIIDMLNQQDENGGGRYVSFIYVRPKEYYKTRRNWRSDDMKNVLSKYGKEGNEHWFDTVNDFNNDDKIKKLNLGGMIVTTRYNVHWTTKESYDRAYSSYAERLHNLRMRNGIGIESDGMLGDNHNQRQQTDYGPQMNQTNRLSKDFNLASMTSKPISTCYLVDDEGMIKGEIPGDVVKGMNPLPSAPKPEKAVSDVLSGEALEAYMEAKAELDKEFNGKNFLFDRILSIVASVNGVAYYYINDALRSEIAKKSEVYVNPQEMVKIAREQLSASIKEVENYDPAKR